jgi:hypothetical protein
LIPRARPNPLDALSNTKRVFRRGFGFSARMRSVPPKGLDGGRDAAPNYIRLPAQTSIFLVELPGIMACASRPPAGWAVRG